jgi:capsid protein
MFRKVITVTLVIVCAFANGVFAGEEYKNYEITIDEKAYDLNLNEEIQVMDKSGKTVNIVLRKKPYTEYSDQIVSFQHKSELSVSSQDLGNGIKQLMSVTATGTSIIIQEYSNMDPSKLVPSMLKAITKESVEYGYKMTQEKVTRNLNSGIILKGIKAALKYKGKEKYYEMLSYGKKDTGILIITKIGKKYIKTDKELHSHFWNTLKLKF